MPSIWVESLGRAIDQALDQLAAAIRECPDGSWETPMWPVPPLGADHQFLDSDWRPITDPRQRDDLARRWIERRSTPWSVAWHALETFDYDLNGEFSPWSPPQPFEGHPHWRDLPNLPTAWSKPELLGYVEHCRGQAGAVITTLTDEKGALPLPIAHRYGGQPYAWILVGLVGHTTEHAAQLQQFAVGR